MTANVRFFSLIQRKDKTIHDRIRKHPEPRMGARIDANAEGRAHAKGAKNAKVLQGGTLRSGAEGGATRNAAEDKMIHEEIGEYPEPLICAYFR